MRSKRSPLLLRLGEGDSLASRIADALRGAIMDQRLPAGDPLPSSRDLAVQFSAARNTVLAAISRLVDEGLLETRPGAGTFIRPKTPSMPRRPAETAASVDLSEWALRLPNHVYSQRSTSDLLDLRPGLPDLSAVPLNEWRRSAMRKMRTSRSRLASYGPPEGQPDLRREIAQYVVRSRGVVCDAGDVIVTNGAQQAFDLIARVLIRPDTKIAVEDPGYPYAIQAFTVGGALLCGVPVDEQGIDVARIPEGATLVYTTPSHQFPLGVTLSHERRRALLAWASDHQAIVVEDDYDSEYRFTGSALPALQSDDSDGRVIYVGTFSKSLMPGIRLGYMIVPRRLQGVFIDAKYLLDAHSENVMQAVLSEFMENGGFNRHVRKMQSIYSMRYKIMQNYCNSFHELGAILLPSQGGLHACLLLPPHQREEVLIETAASVGLELCGLKDFFVGAPSFPGLALGFGNIDAVGLRSALGRLLGLLGRDRP